MAKIFAKRSSLDLALAVSVAYRLTQAALDIGLRILTPDSQAIAGLSKYMQALFDCTSGFAPLGSQLPEHKRGPGDTGETEGEAGQVLQGKMR